MLVLVADDIAAIPMSLTRLVEKLGHDAVSAKDGEPAWQFIAQHPIEMVISD